jgi:hypothetical protein
MRLDGSVQDISLKACIRVRPAYECGLEEERAVLSGWYNGLGRQSVLDDSTILSVVPRLREGKIHGCADSSGDAD